MVKHASNLALKVCDETVRQVILNKVTIVKCLLSKHGRRLSPYDASQT